MSILSISFFKSLDSFRNSFYLVFCGICMGACDLVPGISGGTLAFIMGFYFDLLKNIKSLSFKNFFKNPATWFLSRLIFGISLSIALLAPLFDHVLNQENERVLLYSAFLGLILASILLSLKEVKVWSLKEVLVLLIGGAMAFLLTSVDLKMSSVDDAVNSGFFMDYWILFCGSVAVSALLLPGISGSYLLTILGSYSTVIEALSEFIQSLKHGVFEVSAFSILFSLTIGVVVGGLLFSRCVLWLLKHYHSLTIAMMTGFMIGALQTVWPFWSYSHYLNPLKIERGVRLIPIEPILPEISIELIYSFTLMLFGFCLVNLVNFLAKERRVVQNVNQ